MASTSALPVATADRDLLLRWVRAPSTPQRVAMRSTIVVLAGLGWTTSAIAVELGVTRRTVATWRARFVAGGPAALLADAPGRGRKKGRDPQLVARVLEALRGTPPQGAARWTMRSLARHLGVSHATVHRVWREAAITSGAMDREIAIPETPPGSRGA